MKDLQVKDIMTKELVTVSQYDTLQSVRKIFSEKSIHHLPVMEEKKLIGIISNADFERSKVGKSLFANHNIEEQNDTLLSTTLVGMVMTEVVETISADESLLNAYQIFKKKSYRSLPVVEQEKLVGILTPMDFLDYYFQQTTSNG